MPPQPALLIKSDLPAATRPNLRRVSAESENSVVVLIPVAVLLGLVYGRVPAAVAERVFDSDAAPLLLRSDLLRPLSVHVRRRRLAAVTQILCGGLFGAAAAIVGDRWVLPAFLWFVAVTLTLVLTDVDRKLIPNRILYPGFVAGVVVLVAGSLIDGDPGRLGRTASGAAAFFGFLLVLALVAGEGFGMGDVKLGALLGAFTAYEGWSILVVAAVGSFVLGGAVSLVLLVLRIKGRKDAIPFGPYLVAGAYLALAAGEPIADWYGG